MKAGDYVKVAPKKGSAPRWNCKVLEISEDGRFVKVDGVSGRHPFWAPIAQVQERDL